MDTVTLAIEYPDFKVTRPVQFHPRAHFNSDSDISPDVARKDVYKVFKQWQSKEDKDNSVYKPVINIIQKMKQDSRQLTWFLNIQVSVPRVLYPNNIYEISPIDIAPIVKELQQILSTMGIEITFATLERASVKKFHLGKNIILLNDYTVSQAIALLAKTVASRQTKKRESHYENDGEAFHFYTQTHDRIFYDKFKDYERTKCTAIDKYRLKSERSLGKKFIKNGIQMLRFEVRYNSQQTVVSKLRPYIHAEDGIIHFSDLFNQELWRKILVAEWEDIVGVPASQIALKFETSPDQALQAFLKHICFDRNTNNVYALNKVNDLYGTFSAIRDMGVQWYKNMLEQTFSAKTLGIRLDDKLTLIYQIVSEIPVHPIISQIHSEIQACERLTPTWIEDNIG